MMRMMMTVAAACSLLAGSAAAQGTATPADSARPIAIDEAVRLAQKNSPSVVQAAGSVRNANASVRSSYGALLPSLSVSSGITRTGGARSGTSGTLENTVVPWQFSNGVSLGATIFNGGKNLFDIGAAKASVGAAEANEVASGFTVALNVKQQYYNVLAARESESAARVQLQQAQEQLKQAAAKVAAGTATKSDSLRGVVQVGNAQLALLTAQTNLQVANANLTRLVGTPYQVTAELADTLDATLAPVDSATLATLAAKGPAVTAARANVSAAHAAGKSARAPYLPSIDVSYQFGNAGTSSGFSLLADQYRNSNSLRFGLSYPIFNGFAREEGIVRANVAEDVANATLHDAELGAQQLLVQYIASLRTARERIAVQTVTISAAEEDLRVQQQRYALGASTLLDVLTSQTALNQARLALIQARYDYRVARAQIETVIGRPL